MRYVWVEPAGADVSVNAILGRFHQVVSLVSVPITWALPIGAPRITSYVRRALSRSHEDFHEIRTRPGSSAASVGVSAVPSCGPSRFGERLRTAMRTRPCCGLLLTRGNSPPRTTYSLFAATLQAAWLWPLNVPTVRVGSQCRSCGAGRPLKGPPAFTRPPGSAVVVCAVANWNVHGSSCGWPPIMPQSCGWPTWYRTPFTGAVSYVSPRQPLT